MDLFEYLAELIVAGRGNLLRQLGACIRQLGDHGGQLLTLCPGRLLRAVQLGPLLLDLFEYLAELIVAGRGGKLGNLRVDRLLSVAHFCPFPLGFFQQLFEVFRAFRRYPSVFPGAFLFGGECGTVLFELLGLACQLVFAFLSFCFPLVFPSGDFRQLFVHLVEHFGEELPKLAVSSADFG